MDIPSEIWSSLYFVPVIGVFALAGAVYYLSFRSKGDDNQSLRIYLNVLSGDDEKNRKAAKKLRKFGTATKRLMTTGSGLDDDAVPDAKPQQQVDSVLVESLSTAAASRKAQLVLLNNKKADLPYHHHVAFSSAAAAILPTPATASAESSSAASSTTTPSNHSQVPEVVTDAPGAPPVVVSDDDDAADVAAASLLLDDGVDAGEPAAPELAVTGWHKAPSSRNKSKKHQQQHGLESKTTAAEDATDATNLSTTSDESRPSFRNSISSRNSSPSYRKFSGDSGGGNSRRSSHNNSNAATKTTLHVPAKPPHHQRPDHLKLESSVMSTSSTFTSSSSSSNDSGNRRTGGVAGPSSSHSSAKSFAAAASHPTILLSKAPEAAASVVLKKAQQHALLPGSLSASSCSSFRSTAAVKSNSTTSTVVGIPRTFTANDHLHQHYHQPPSPRTVSANASATGLPPGQTDMCIQTEADEDYPSPLEGLRQVAAGKPRFVICHDFQMQVDMDAPENGSESESELRFEDGDKIIYSSGASLSSGEGSSRVTPVLEDDFPREFSMTAEKSQGVHQRGQTYNNRINSRQSGSHHQHQYQHQYQQQSQQNFPPPSYYGNGDHPRQAPYHQQPDGKRTGTGDAAAVYYAGHNELRSCRVEKGSSDWIDNSSRLRGRTPINGRWRN
ncbi:hypothetical protein BV898_05761 [Hypsibius exemplaris]|uniref:Uncharacterized protein n=1 Tax=Hypsibius exemplaris TaxID=2072580 RepID=A0A1W0WYC4_HYPEX|nr:hypothetical protein BV898_05761 [Hypsibius exemplaris]